MVQTAEEYMQILYRTEIESFGFTGTSVPPHTKEITFVCDDHLLPLEQKERLENIASRCMMQRKPLPDGIRLVSVRIDAWEDWE